MNPKAYCSRCAAALRADDRFCPRCGATGNAAASADVHVREFRPKDGPLQRLGDFAVDHAKGLLAVLAIGALGATGLLVGEEKPVPENTSSPGYQMVRQLKSSGAIDTFNAVSPEDGWDTEYSLDDGDAHIRFRGTEMEYGVRSYDTDLRDAIESAARSDGFSA